MKARTILLLIAFMISLPYALGYAITTTHIFVQPWQWVLIGVTGLFELLFILSYASDKDKAHSKWYDNVHTMD